MVGITNKMDSIRRGQHGSQKINTPFSFFLFLFCFSSRQITESHDQKFEPGLANAKDDDS